MASTRHELFPHIAYTIEAPQLLEPTLELLDKFIKRDKWFKNGTDTIYLLTKYAPELAEQYEQVANTALEEQGFDNTFSLTTSWFTRTFTEGLLPHRHHNSYYSASYYFHDNCGELSIWNPHTRDIKVPRNIDPTVQKFPCTKGTMILFPSYLVHAVGGKTTADPRYSIALNLMPNGLCYGWDSTYEYLKG